MFARQVWELTANRVIMVSAIGNDGPLYGYVELLVDVCVGQEVVQVTAVNVQQTCCLAGLGRVPKRPSGQAPMSFDLKKTLLFARLVIGDLLSLAVSVQAR